MQVMVHARQEAARAGCTKLCHILFKKLYSVIGIMQAVIPQMLCAMPQGSSQEWLKLAMRLKQKLL